MGKKLQKDPSLLKLGGETKTMTFMFSDIRGFTPISEKYKSNPAGLTKLINRFLTRMTNVVIANGGTIDKFMGDCIMAFWNAPLDVKDHQMLAVMTASQMQTELARLNEELEAEGVIWAREILRNSPTAIRILKASFNAENDGIAGIQELSGYTTQLFYSTEEAQEGRDAFLEKRPPDFSDYKWTP